MIHILTGDCRSVLPTLAAASVQCCVTSPPYFGLRDYGVEGQIGLESTPEEYVSELVGVFRQVRRVLKDDGTLWINLGDSYAGSWGAQSKRVVPGEISRNSVTNHPKRPSHTGRIRMAGVKPKDLYGIPWMVAFALRVDGWYLRKDIIWHKPGPMPESVTDRPTSAHEHVFFLAKSSDYFYDAAAIAEAVTDVRDGALSTRNARDVWTVATRPYPEAHSAVMPLELASRCIKAGSRVNDTVIDPFGGAGTTAIAADRLSRHGTIIDLNAQYSAMSERRARLDGGMFTTISREVLNGDARERGLSRVTP